LRLLHLRAQSRDNEEHHDGQQRRRDGRQGERDTTVLVTLDELTDHPSGHIHPRERGGKEETLAQRRQGLTLELLRDNLKSISNLAEDGGGRGRFNNSDVLLRNIRVHGNRGHFFIL